MGYNCNQRDTSSSISQGEGKNLSYHAKRREAAKQRGDRQCIRSVLAVDTRGDDSCSSLQRHLRDGGSDSHDVPRATQYRRATISKGGKKKHKKIEAASVSYIAKQSQDSQISDSIDYWTFLSVRAAMAVMQANGSEMVAEKAANTVLDARRPTTTLRALAAELSVAVLNAGGDPKVAAAVIEAIASSKDDAVLKTKPSEDIDSPDTRSDIRNASSFYSKNSQGVASVTPSMTAKIRRLKEREDEIIHKTRALEEAEQVNLQKEKEIELAEAARLENVQDDKLGVKWSIDHNDGERSVAHAISHSYSTRQSTPLHSRISQDVSSVISFMSVKRRRLKAKEDEIAKMTRALEEAEQLNMQKEKEIMDQLAKAEQLENGRGGMLMVGSPFDNANGLLNGHHASNREEIISHSNSSMTAKQRQLKEKEDEIARKSRELEEAALAYRQKEKEIMERMEEAARLNLQRENEISERLAALDAAEAAYAERLNNEQPKMNWRVAQLNLQRKENEFCQKLATLNTAEADFQEKVNRQRVEVEGPQTGQFSVASRGSESVQNIRNSPPRASQLPQKENNNAFGDLTGRLSSFLDGSVLNQLPSWQIGPPSPTQNTRNMDMIHDSYSTHASDSTSLVTNRTEDYSKARTALSFSTEDQHTLGTGVSALTADTGWKTQNQHMLSQALYTAMNQYSTQATEASRNNSFYTLRSINESSNKSPSDKYPPIDHSRSKSSINKLKSSFLSFSTYRLSSGGPRHEC